MYKITLKQGNLLDDKQANIAINPSNTSLILGSGLSMAFKNKCGNKLQHLMYKSRQDILDSGYELEQGDIVVTKSADCSSFDYIFHACIMNYTSAKKREDKSPSLQTIETTLLNMENYFNSISLNTIVCAIPMMGCGVGGLNIEEVANIYKEFFARDITKSIEIIVYGYSTEDYNILKKVLNPTKQDRYKGAMLGLAIGDALGAPYEFKARNTFKAAKAWATGGKFNTSLGEYTDDTAMALCLAQSLIDKQGVDQKDQLSKYVKWYKEDYMSANGRSIGCGKTTIVSLMKFMNTNCSECGNSKMKKGAGNGSLMRVAPIALYYAENRSIAMKMAAKSSYTTHGLKVCADACSLFVGLLIGALDNMTKEEFLSKEYLSYLMELNKEYTYDTDVINILSGSYKYKTKDEIRSSGYVLDTLEAALWAFYNSDTYEEGVFMAINLGEDTDTVAAVYGQLAGAYYGVNGIDKVYIKYLMNRELIINISNKLLSSRDRNKKFLNGFFRDIEICSFEYICPLEWENLIGSDEDSLKFCTQCNESVYKVNDMEEYKDLGKKVCIFIDTSDSKSILGLPRHVRYEDSIF